METTFQQTEKILEKSPVYIPGHLKEGLIEDITESIAVFLNLEHDESKLFDIDAIITQHLQKFYKKGHGAIKYSDSEYLEQS